MQILWYVYTHDDNFSENFFNWSMTYRRDVDVPMPYGGWWVNPEKSKTLGLKPENLTTNSTAILDGKQKPIFWLVSNCNTVSKREVAVKQLTQ